MTINSADPTQPQARALLEQSHALMASLFHREANHHLSVEELTASHIGFFLAKEEGEPLGCLALADHGSYGEVKSLFVVPAARGRGVAEAMMAHLKAVARTRKLKTLRLETGKPGLEAAHRLYERHGFTDCAAFGDYEPDAPYSRYMELSL